mmetsp:Transcript_42360/g.135631  ORF Transcript_42360/g.135631 Transcript_42360/m.135631 type:complete len:253 (-) Transcript_42360:135-893(-)
MRGVKPNIAPHYVSPSLPTNPLDASRGHIGLSTSTRLPVGNSTTERRGPSSHPNDMPPKSPPTCAQLSTPLTRVAVRRHHVAERVPRNPRPQVYRRQPRVPSHVLVCGPDVVETVRVHRQVDQSTVQHDGGDEAVPLPSLDQIVDLGAVQGKSPPREQLQRIHHHVCYEEDIRAAPLGVEVSDSLSQGRRDLLAAATAAGPGRYGSRCRNDVAEGGHCSGGPPTHTRLYRYFQSPRQSPQAPQPTLCPGAPA